MSNVILGWFLIGVGALFLLAAVAGAARIAFAGALRAVAPGLQSVIVDVTNLIKTILTAPGWLLMAAVGGILIYAGQRVLAGLSVWPF